MEGLTILPSPPPPLHYTIVPSWHRRADELHAVAGHVIGDLLRALLVVPAKENATRHHLMLRPIRRGKYGRDKQNKKINYRNKKQKQKQGSCAKEQLKYNETLAYRGIIAQTVQEACALQRNVRGANN
jgi:hypothetical protein